MLSLLSFFASSHKTFINFWCPLCTPSNLPNATSSYLQTLDMPTEISYVPQASVSQEQAANLSVSRYSFVALSDTSIRIYFNILNGYAINAYNIALNRPTNSSMNFRTGRNDYGYFVEVYGIESANIDSLFTLTLTFKGDNSTTTLTYSALNYIDKIIKETTNQKLKDMGVAIYQYNLCAKAYFNKNNGFNSQLGDLTINGGTINIGARDMQIVSDGGDAVAYSNVVAKNLEFSADIMLEENGAGALLIRADQANNNFYSINIDKTGNIAKFWKKVDGVVTDIAVASVTINSGKYYNLKVVALGPNITVYLDNQLVISAVDYALTEGKLGLNVFLTSARFNNIKYTTLNAVESNVAILGENSYEWLLVYFAALLIS